ncbi:MAG: histidine phosphatase family protein [Acidimicrobiales bacterium]|nr:histidine phosphatase family protein [Acidimicrobiales bacterium]
MARLRLVRHGQAAAGWGDDHDPGLSALGLEQAAAAAGGVGLGSDDPLPSILSSPLRRARETAAAFSEALGTPARIDAAFGEIPSPSTGLAERDAWLRAALVGTWSDLDSSVAAWRSSLLGAIRALRGDTVVVTHFVAINAVVGAAAGSDLVTTFLPANASITTVVVDPDGSIAVEALGSEAPPVIS